jgi:glycerol-3-phosphate acyltransferase PlsY
MGLGDIREIGSGNIGATNVLRTGRKEIAFLTLLLDMLKGTLAALFALLYAPDFVPYAALAALLGHIFPIWLKFKGGKGVATALGVYIAICPLAAVMALFEWLLAAAVLRISSISALLAIGTMPIFLAIFNERQYIWVSFVIMAIVYLKHYQNIIRLIHGTEPKIGEKGQNENKDTFVE